MRALQAEGSSEQESVEVALWALVGRASGLAPGSTWK